MTRNPIRELGPADLERINGILESFVSETGARCALLLDRAGRAVTAFGDTADLDETSFASLAAADFEASDQLAGLLGEDEFTALYHQGAAGSMYLADIGGAAILAAVFDRRTTLGMVRLKTRAVVPQLLDLLEELGRRPERSGERLEAGWLDDAVDQIDRLFG
ncbi:MAG TPA: roadblock/LC7 domain-containing protein [Longimicrobiales bacterium]|nr:roadblock/LC7 domain-containing protein [Longimicrobiales bacterium]